MLRILVWLKESSSTFPNEVSLERPGNLPMPQPKASRD
jgi:hypothetical protein